MACCNIFQLIFLRSYKLAAIKLVTPSKEHLEKHYEDLSDKPFFKGLVTCKLVHLCLLDVCNDKNIFHFSIAFILTCNC